MSEAAVVARFWKKIKTQPSDRILRDIAQGLDLPTRAVVRLSSPDHVDEAFLRRLIGAGLVATVFQLLDRCEEEKFADVLGRDGDLPSPEFWLMMLVNTVFPDNVTCKDLVLNTRMEIARGIGPLVRCLTDDSKRMFFGENRFWCPCIGYFVGLVEALVLSPETVPILIQYQGLTEFLIECMFWNNHRPDIVVESRTYVAERLPNPLEIVVKCASRTLREFARVDKVTIKGGVRFPDEGTKRLELIASTKIVSEKYNPDCKVNFAAGLFDLIKADPSEYVLLNLWFIVRHLVWAQLCIDRATIVRIVKHGLTNVKFSIDAYGLVDVLHLALVPRPETAGRGRNLDDDLFAAAIKAGLIEMCLHLILRFGANSENEPPHDGWLDTLGYLLDGASAVSLFKKSAKAVTEHRSEIQEVLRSAVGKTEGKSSKLVEKVRSIVSINMETGKKTEKTLSDSLKLEHCDRCLKELQADQIKLCSKCHRGPYSISARIFYLFGRPRLLFCSFQPRIAQENVKLTTGSKVVISWSASG